MNRLGSLLMVTGTLRRSIRCQVNADSVMWESSEKYASLHNDGGTLTVTAKMKRFFWYKYKVTNDESWKWMALMKTGAVITIPQRQFLGDHPQVRKAAERIINDNLQNAANAFIKNFKP